MMQRWRAGMFAAVVGTLWALPSALASETSELVEAAAVRRHLEAWPEVSAAARDAAGGRLDAEALALLEAEVARAFDPDALLARLDPAALAGGDGEALLRGWRESGALGLLGPIGGLGPSELHEYPRFASQVGAGVPPTRLQLTARIDEATGFGRNAWRVSSASAWSLARGARLLACEGAGWEPRPGREEIGDLTAMARDFQERVHVELLFHARHRSGAELQRALRFLESPPGTAFRDRLAQAIPTALAEATRQLHERLEAKAAKRCR